MVLAWVIEDSELSGGGGGEDTEDLKSSLDPFFSKDYRVPSNSSSGIRDPLFKGNKNSPSDGDDSFSSWSSILFFGFLERKRRQGAQKLCGDAGRKSEDGAADEEEVIFHIEGASRNELFLSNVFSYTFFRFLWIEPWECVWVFSNACTQVVCFALSKFFKPSLSSPSQGEEEEDQQGYTWRCFMMPEGKGLETADEEAFPQGLCVFREFKEKMFRDHATTDTAPLDSPPVFFLLQSDGNPFFFLLPSDSS